MIILASIFVVSGGSFILFKGYRYHLTKKLANPRFLIDTVVQTGSRKEALNTQYIAELMGLSQDRPQHIYLFDVQRARANLLQSPVIKECVVKKNYPSTIYVDYELRTPFALVGDYDNLAMDENENLFPLKPFFTPQFVPEIYLGVHEPNDFDVKKASHLAIKVLKEAKKRFHLTRMKIERIDVSRSFLPSLGQKEIVARMSDEFHSGDKSFTFKYLLRMNHHDYAQNLRDFFSLRKELLKEQQAFCSELQESVQKHFEFTKTIDLRIDSLAYIAE